MWSEQKHASSWEVGGTTTSMVAAGEVIKMLGTMFHSFIWGGVNSRVDIAIWLHNVGVGVKMPGLPFPSKTEASALNNSLTFPLPQRSSSDFSVFFCDEREHKQLQGKWNRGKLSDMVTDGWWFPTGGSLSIFSSCREVSSYRHYAKKSYL